MPPENILLDFSPLLSCNHTNDLFPALKPKLSLFDQDPKRKLVVNIRYRI
jgi:hypothetical protein